MTICRLITADGKRAITSDGKPRIGAAGDPCCCTAACPTCASIIGTLPSSASLDISGTWGWIGPGDDPAYVCRGQLASGEPPEDSIDFFLADPPVCGYSSTEDSIDGWLLESPCSLSYIAGPTPIGDGSVILDCGWSLEILFISGDGSGELFLNYFLSGTSPIGTYVLVYAACAGSTTNIMDQITDHTSLVAS